MKPAGFQAWATFSTRWGWSWTSRRAVTGSSLTGGEIVSLHSGVAAASARDSLPTIKRYEQKTSVSGQAEAAKIVAEKTSLAI